MSGNLPKFGGIIFLLAVGTIFLSTYIVDKTQYAIEILLGDPVDIVMEPGPVSYTHLTLPTSDLV